MHRLVDGLLISTLVLTACSDDPSSTSTDDSSETDDSGTDTGSSDTEAGSSGTDATTTSETGETTGTGECSQSPALLCDTMIPFYEDARALHESTETGCQLLWIYGRGVGPDGILVDVFPIEPTWIVSYVCPGRRIEYAYSALTVEYPLVTEFVEDVDPSDFKQIESAIVDSPGMMELYAGTNCPDILTVEDPRFIFQPSAIGQSTAVFQIGEPFNSALLTVDAMGALVEIIPCP